MAKSTRVRNTRTAASSFKFEFLNPSQKMAWATIDKNDAVFLIGPAGTAKALTLESKLFTKDGPITMGQVKIGDEIANPDGGFSKVIGVYPQGKKQICRVFFKDGRHVDCCEDHLWTVNHRDNGWTRVVDTKYLEANGRRKSDGKRLLSIKCPMSVAFQRKSYVIDPYFMGIILSEGGLTTGNLVFTSCEKQVIDRVSSTLSLDYVYKSKGLNKIDHRVVKKNRSNSANLYMQELRELGLWGKYAYEKSIPDIYKFGSVDQRIALLQGLMDGDGTVSEKGCVSYCSTSEKLAKDFCELIYSLGGTTQIKQSNGCLKKDGSRHRDYYRCFVNLPSDIAIFFLDRKSKRCKSRTRHFPKLYIDRVERLGDAEMQCITVDHKDSLYLTDNYVVTHNTHIATAYAISKILSGEIRKIYITRPVVEAEEKLGFLPGTLEDKVFPYMIPIYDCIEKCVGKETPLAENIKKCLEIAPLAFLRGRTLDHAVCILDEAQNCTKGQIKLFLTRLGVDSKMIVTGDPMQSDLRGGIDHLMDTVDDLDGVEGVGIVELTNEAIVRHPLVGRILDRLERDDEDED